MDVLGGSVAYLVAIPAFFAVLALRLDTWRTVVALIAVAHVVVLVSVALFPLPVNPAVIAGGRGFASHTAGEALNLIPFRTIAAQVAGRFGTEGRLEAVLNLFVLTPAGVYLPILLPRLRSWRAFLPVAIILGGSIEAAQLAISLALGFRYRTIDVDDWILNTAGLLIGYAAWRLWRVMAERRGLRTSPAG